MRGFFVAGTDTGVGKTEIARALCTLIPGVRALKPVETGCDDLDQPADALALREACLQKGSDEQKVSHLQKRSDLQKGSSSQKGSPLLSLDDVCPYRFHLPAAPLVAAEAEGRQIDLDRILALAAREPIVVEPAGGLLVPFARRDGAIFTNLDLARELRLPVVLVARAGLGTLNHSALSYAALRGLEVVAIVLNRSSAQDDPSVESNPRWVRELTGARVLGPTPFVADSAARPRVLAQCVDSLVPRR